MYNIQYNTSKSFNNNLTETVATAKVPKCNRYRIIFTQKLLFFNKKNIQCHKKLIDKLPN